MSKGKTSKTNAIRKLDKKNIAYKIHHNPWTDEGPHAKKKIVSEENRIFKTLVVKGNETGPIVVCLPASKEINLKTLAKVSNNKKVELLPLEELEKTTGYIRGGTSPIGMKKSYKTFIAREAEDLITIIVSAGKRGLQIELAPQDLLYLTKGTLADISSSINN